METGSDKKQQSQLAKDMRCLSDSITGLEDKLKGLRGHLSPVLLQRVQEKSNEKEGVRKEGSPLSLELNNEIDRLNALNNFIDLILEDSQM